MEIISHYKDKYTPPQTNEEHQCGVADLARRFADQFGMGSYGAVLGLLHDKGKKQSDFQTYIRKVSGMCPELRVRNHPNHAYVGALIARKYYAKKLPFLAYPIMCHHAGLYDYPDYDSKLRQPIPPDVDASSCGIDLQLPHFPSLPKPYDFNHVIRMLFSCLVDADFLDTERYMRPDEFARRQRKKSLSELKPMLDNYLSQLRSSAPQSSLNTIRDEIQSLCLISRLLQSYRSYWWWKDIIFFGLGYESCHTL